MYLYVDIGATNRPKKKKRAPGVNQQDPQMKIHIQQKQPQNSNQMEQMMGRL